MLTPQNGTIFSDPDNGIYIQQVGISSSLRSDRDQLLFIVQQGRVYVHSNEKNVRVPGADIRGGYIGTTKADMKNYNKNNINREEIQTNIGGEKV